MIFCVFSYNRATFLNNCLRSIEACAPGATICIVDDDSDDPETRKLLAREALRHEVLPSAQGRSGKHGGLYANMQRALEHVGLQRGSSAEAPLVCFMQDDMQLVRPLDDQDMQAIQRYFHDSPRSGFLQPCFHKGATRARDQVSLQYDSGSHTYWRVDTGQSAGRYYSDIFICSPRRLLERGWRFASSEPANEQQARALFPPMGHVFSPFMMWLPEVPAWRGKRKTLALKIAERRRRCGFYPFRTMAAEQVKRLRQRPPDSLPVAEDFLQCTQPDLPRPWSYYPLQGNRWLKKLNSAETFLRRLGRHGGAR